MRRSSHLTPWIGVIECWGGVEVKVGNRRRGSDGQQVRAAGKPPILLCGRYLHEAREWPPPRRARGAATLPGPPARSLLPCPDRPASSFCARSAPKGVSHTIRRVIKRPCTSNELLAGLQTSHTPSEGLSRTSYSKKTIARSLQSSLYGVKQTGGEAYGRFALETLRIRIGILDFF